MAGPASECVARPATVKIPAPMTTPTPKTVRSRAVSLFLELVLRLITLADRLFDRLVRMTFMGLSPSGVALPLCPRCPSPWQRTTRTRRVDET